MNPLSNPLEGFAPALYLSVLSSVAHADGLHPIEEELLQQQAANFGLDLKALPPMPDDLGDIPWPTRVLVYRDAVMLALADDGALSAEENEYLRALALRLALPLERAQAILAWVEDYSAILDRFESMLREQGAAPPRSA